MKRIHLPLQQKRIYRGNDKDGKKGKGCTFQGRYAFKDITNV
jgi:hypothetical protein